jgi:plasmid maintenance system antidote protein VapI
MMSYIDLIVNGKTDFTEYDLVILQKSIQIYQSKIEKKENIILHFGENPEKEKLSKEYTDTMVEPGDNFPYVNLLLKFDPIEALNNLMEIHNIDKKGLMKILKLKDSTITKYLSKKSKMSNKTILKLSDYFKVDILVFNRDYELVNKESVGKKEKVKIKPEKKDIKFF